MLFRFGFRHDTDQRFFDTAHILRIAAEALFAFEFRIVKRSNVSRSGLNRQPSCSHDQYHVRATEWKTYLVRSFQDR